MVFFWLEYVFTWWAVLLCLGVWCYVNRHRREVFYVKYFFYVLSYGVISSITMPMMLLNPGNPNNIRISGFFSRWLQAPFAGIRTTVLQERNYPTDQSFIVVCNHQSVFDSLAMMEAFPDNCAVILKKNHVLHWSPFGLAAFLTGAIFVDKGNKNRMEALQKVVDTIHKKKCRVWFFPEGTRKISGKVSTEEPMLPFKKGAFNIAILAQIPVVPVVFSSQEKFFSYRDKISKPGRITVSILPPIPTNNLTWEDVPQLTDKVRATMIEEFKRISE
ncbi:1-acyl-sn-glycerol-3-phosphate acyltransferase alpha-like [Lytechinus variegatus]|uniref:1-acyl-sn-glycerol-3-phosphate acyltransferase alpha-like n=1 Tax=Lytechinus variegatus TaxID=7654 RepID=UPI001BB169B7|nr:1-acyl-sn-glycerol-3-phosphate acyltransferase alpha-like [Lytechinus variegatus]